MRSMFLLILYERNLVMLIIEKGLTHPSQKINLYLDDPWDQLEIGDSFFVKKITLREGKLICQVHSNKFDKNFDATREKGGIRFWRIEKNKDAFSQGNKVDYEDKILKLLEKRGETSMGILANRLRLEYEKTKQIVEVLEKKSLISIRKVTHPRRLTVAYFCKAL